MCRLRQEVIGAIMFALSTAATVCAVDANPCIEGRCAAPSYDHICWLLVSQICVAKPGTPIVTTGPATFETFVAATCDGCAGAPGEVSISLLTETGYEACLTLEAGVQIEGGGTFCGVGLKVTGSVKTGSEACVNTKRSISAEATCRCEPLQLVQCVLIETRVPLTINWSVDYSLRRCFERLSDDPMCDQAGSDLLHEEIYCGRRTHSFSDASRMFTFKPVPRECPRPGDGRLDAIH
jgi:hypothetical protein